MSALKSPVEGKDFNICIGVVTSTNGVRGHVKIISFTDTPHDIANFNEVFDDEQNQYRIDIVSLKKGCIIARIEGVNSRDDAEVLRNRKLYIKRSALPDVNNDEFYYADLIGMEVRNTDGSKIGSVKDVLNFGAGDILEVLSINSEKLVYYPFKSQFVPNIDMVQRYVTVEELEEIIAASDK